jgi:hypothetical protein
LQHQKYHVMENRIKKIVVFIILSTSSLAQKNQSDTLKMFEGHWVFKIAMNSNFTPQELEDTYLKNVRGCKIHIRGTRMYGNVISNSNTKINLKVFQTYSLKSFYDYDDLNEKDFLEFKRLKIDANQKIIGIGYDKFYWDEFPYYGMQFLLSQKFIKIGMDQTMFFLEKDKTEYKFIGVKEAPIYRDDKSLTINKVLENEEVEVLEKGDEYTKIRYWGKALIIGWVKTNNLKRESNYPEYWNIYKNNIIQFQIQNPKSIIYNENHQKTNKYLIKGDTVEVLEEQNYFLKIKFKNIEGFIPRIDVEAYNTFRITKTKVIIHLAPNKPTKMYVLKGDDVELIDRQNDWLKIRFKGKKTIEGWIKKSELE